MIDFPEFKTACQFDKPIFFARQYNFNTNPSYFYKAKGYTEEGLVYGVEVTCIKDEDIVNIRIFTLEPDLFNNYPLGKYFLITEEEYEDAFSKTIKILKE